MPHTTTKSVGELGENLAAEYLSQQGYIILTRNWLSRLGELDIVARSPDGVVVIAEVKTRRASDADPLESITPRKRRILTSTAQVYLAQNQLNDENWRIDIIAVTYSSGRAPHIEHYQDAFDW
jgi:putative endonuclease